MFRKNVSCQPLKKISSWRKISLAAWEVPSDPSIYGALEIDISKGLKLIEALRQKTGKKITVTHLVIKAMAMLLAKYPELNVIIRHRKLYQREHVDVFAQVFLEEEGLPDLSGAKIESCDRKDLAEIASELEERARAIRVGRDPHLKKTKGLLKVLHPNVLAPLLKFLGFLSYDCNLDLSPVGIQKDAFGAAMVTNVGTFGLVHGFAPLVPFSRSPIVATVGQVTEKPVVKNGAITIQPTLHLGFTIDHRIIDGYLAGLGARFIKQVLENPEQLVKT